MHMSTHMHTNILHNLGTILTTSIGEASPDSSSMPKVPRFAIKCVAVMYPLVKKENGQSMHASEQNRSKIIFLTTVAEPRLHNLLG